MSTKSQKSISTVPVSGTSFSWIPFGIGVSQFFLAIWGGVRLMLVSAVRVSMDMTWPPGRHSSARAMPERRFTRYAALAEGTRQILPLRLGNSCRVQPALSPRTDRHGRVFQHL